MAEAMTGQLIYIATAQPFDDEMADRIARHRGDRDDRYGSGGGGDSLRVGDKVEARYRGKARYYPGRIGRANLNGTYDIDYDDGEKEREVDSELVKPLGGSSRPSRGDGRFGDEREPLVDDGLVLFLHRLSHGVRLRFDDVDQIRIKLFIVQFVNQPCGDA